MSGPGGAAPSPLPHLVSLARPALGLVVLFTLRPGAETPWLLVAVAAACASDWADGQLARRFGRPTLRGRLVDNLCDAVFLLCVFAFLAAASTWTPPVWGRLARHWPGANWLPVYALAASFGVYFVRLATDMAAGREPERSARGHAAGVSNYALAVAGAVETLPGVGLGPWLLEPAMIGVALINLWSIPENLRLMFQRGRDGPKMPG